MLAEERAILYQLPWRCLPTRPWTVPIAVWEHTLLALHFTKAEIERRSHEFMEETSGGFTPHTPLVLLNQSWLGSFYYVYGLALSPVLDPLTSAQLLIKVGSDSGAGEGRLAFMINRFDLVTVFIPSKMPSRGGWGRGSQWWSTCLAGWGTEFSPLHKNRINEIKR